MLLHQPALTGKQHTLSLIFFPEAESSLHQTYGVLPVEMSQLFWLSKQMTIPGLAEGSSIHVVVWDNKKNKKSEETLIYKAPFKKMLKEYDFILIDKLN
jgi:hypothetical protein